MLSIAMLIAALVLLAFAAAAIVSVLNAPATLDVRKPGDPYPDAPGCVTDVIPGEGFGGYFEAEIIRDGPRGPEVIQRCISHNLVVNTGKRQAWRIMTGLNAKVFDQMRVGSGSAAPNSANTNIQTPITGTLNTADSITMDGRTGVWVISYPSGVGSKSATIREAVVLNENTSPGGSALARALLSPVLVKTTADKARIRYRARIT